MMMPLVNHSLNLYYLLSIDVIYLSCIVAFLVLWLVVLILEHVTYQSETSSTLTSL